MRWLAWQTAAGEALPNGARYTAPPQPAQLAAVREKYRVLAAYMPEEWRALEVSPPFRSIATEIYLYHAWSCQEILRTETAGQAEWQKLVGTGQAPAGSGGVAAGGADGSEGARLRRAERQSTLSTQQDGGSFARTVEQVPCAHRVHRCCAPAHIARADECRWWRCA
jgi:hypothetical protein